MLNGTVNFGATCIEVKIIFFLSILGNLPRIDFYKKIFHNLLESYEFDYFPYTVNRILVDGEPEKRKTDISERTLELFNRIIGVKEIMYCYCADVCV